MIKEKPKSRLHRLSPFAENNFLRPTKEPVPTPRPQTFLVKSLHLFSCFSFLCLKIFLFEGEKLAQLPCYYPWICSFGTFLCRYMQRRAPTLFSSFRPREREAKKSARARRKKSAKKLGFRVQSHSAWGRARVLSYACVSYKYKYLFVPCIRIAWIGKYQFYLHTVAIVAYSPVLFWPGLAWPGPALWLSYPSSTVLTVL